MSQDESLSKVEALKRESQFLRGTIPEELANSSDAFDGDAAGLLKFHGTYQQDNRDERGSDQKTHIFMVRTRIPGGRLTADQLLAELDLCDELGNTTLRITSRQGLQHHGVLKRNLAAVIRRINEVQLSTLGACGDVNRNVMCCPAPFHSPVHDEMQGLAARLADHFAPRTASYHDIWLTDLATGERRVVGRGAAADEIEPIYGRQYLPRKFKMAVALPHDNCVDAYTNDLALLAVLRDGGIAGYNVLVGGGQGTTPANKKTFPALAKRLAFVTPDRAVAAAEAVVKVQRDFGNRSDRKLARLKYLIHGWGLEAFRAKVEEYYGGRLDDPQPDEVHGFDDHIGWHAQGDGKWFYGLNVENGRIRDTAQTRLKAALREICRVLRPGIRLTAHQSILFTDVPDGDRAELERTLRAHGVPLSEEISEVRRWSMACVAWPTCGLSITESERALPGVIDRLEAELARLDLARERLTVRMTGCPNGCARPYNCDVGLVGKARDRYTVLLGGRVLGDRLNVVYRDLVPLEKIADTLVPLFVYFKQERTNGESFGEFCARKGMADLQAWAEAYLERTGNPG